MGEDFCLLRKPDTAVIINKKQSSKVSESLVIGSSRRVLVVGCRGHRKKRREEKICKAKRALHNDVTSIDRSTIRPADQSTRLPRGWLAGCSTLNYRYDTLYSTLKRKPGRAAPTKMHHRRLRYHRDGDRNRDGDDEDPDEDAAHCCDGNGDNGRCNGGFPTDDDSNDDDGGNDKIRHNFGNVSAARPPRSRRYGGGGRGRCRTRADALSFFAVVTVAGYAFCHLVLHYYVSQTAAGRQRLQLQLQQHGKPLNVAQLLRDISSSSRTGRSNNTAAPPAAAKLAGYALVDRPDVLPRTLRNADSYPATTSSCGDADDTTTTIRTTLVIQSSLDRLWVLPETCRRWKDPIVLVVAVRSHDINKGDSTGNDNNNTALNAALERYLAPSDVCEHMTVIEYRLTEERSAPERDPLNHLRNVGLDAARTSHVLVMDVDLVPSWGLDEIIRSALENRNELRRIAAAAPVGGGGEGDDDGVNKKGPVVIPPEENEALVVPAFERYSPSSSSEAAAVEAAGKNVPPVEYRHWLLEDSSFIPRTFRELKMCLNDAECEIVCKFTNYYGHATTRTEDWLNRMWYEDGEEAVVAVDEGEDDDDDATAAKNGDANKKKREKMVRPKRIRSVKCLDTPDWEWVR